MITISSTPSAPQGLAPSLHSGKLCPGWALKSASHRRPEEGDFESSHKQGSSQLPLEPFQRERSPLLKARLFTGSPQANRDDDSESWSALSACRSPRFHMVQSDPQHLTRSSPGVWPDAAPKLNKRKTKASPHSPIHRTSYLSRAGP